MLLFMLNLLFLTAGQRTLIGQTPCRQCQAAQTGMIDDIPQQQQIETVYPAAAQAQCRVVIAQPDQHHQYQRGECQQGQQERPYQVRALLAPDLNAERQCECKDKHQCHRHHQLTNHIIHQAQRVFHPVSRPQHNRQQRQCQAHQSAAAGTADFRIDPEVCDSNPLRFHNPVTPLKQHPEESQLAGDSPHQCGIRTAGFQAEIAEGNHKQ